MSVEFWAATQYSIDLSRNVIRWMNSKVEKWQCPWAALTWYKNDKYWIKWDKKILEDWENFTIMKELWNKLLKWTYSLSDLIEQSKKMWLKNQNWNEIKRSTFYDLFSNPFYYWSFRRKWWVVKWIHKAMITKDDFDKAQEIIKLNSKRIKTSRDARKKVDHTFLFNWLIQCWECWMSIIRERPKFKKLKSWELKVYNYLRCSKRSMKCKCSQKCIIEKDFYKQINDIAESLTISKPIVDWVFNKLENDFKENRKSYTKKKSEIQNKINKNEELINNAWKKLVQWVISDEAYQDIITDFKNKRTFLKSEILRYDNKKDNWIEEIRKDFKLASEIKDVFDFWNKENKR